MSLIHRLLLATAAMAIMGLTAGLAVAQENKPQKYARFVGAGGQPVFGLLEGDSLREITGAPYGEWQKTERVVPVAGVKFLPVTDARNVYAMAGNYRDHLVGLPPERLEKFKIPQFFLKATTSLCGHGDDIRYPSDAGRVDYEGELVIVIGKGGRDIPKEKALQHVFGVSVGNDVSARDWQSNDVQWWRAKGSDTFGPCGPFIATGLDYGNLDMQVRVNGEVMMKTNTSLMVHDIATSIAFLSRHVTLQPGDLIFTGTAGKTEPIKVGDVVEVELQGVGILRNTVVAREQAERPDAKP